MNSPRRRELRPKGFGSTGGSPGAWSAGGALPSPSRHRPSSFMQRCSNCGRSPLLIIVSATFFCNLIAYAFFFSVDRILPKNERDAHLPHGTHSSSFGDSGSSTAAGKATVQRYGLNTLIPKQDSPVDHQDITSLVSHATIDTKLAKPGGPLPPAPPKASKVQPADQEPSPISLLPVTTTTTPQQQNEPQTTARQTQQDAADVALPAHGDALLKDMEQDLNALSRAQGEEQLIAQHLQEVTSKWRNYMRNNMFDGQAGMQADSIMSNSQWPFKGEEAKELPYPEVVANQTRWPIWWMAPFFDQTSFGKEAATMALSMIRSGAVTEEDVWVGTTQGTCQYGVDKSMPRHDYDQLDAANHRWTPRMSSIVVCHSLPPFWARPKNKWDTCFPCPPIGYTPAITIGRAMAETDIYHEEFVKYCNRMDEVWVPSDFSRDVLTKSGVVADKIRIVPIPVNTTRLDPDLVPATLLPVGNLVFGIPRRKTAQAVKSSTAGAASVTASVGGVSGSVSANSRKLQSITTTAAVTTSTTTATTAAADTTTTTTTTDSTAATTKTRSDSSSAQEQAEQHDTHSQDKPALAESAHDSDRTAEGALSSSAQAFARRHLRAKSNDTEQHVARRLQSRVIPPVTIQSGSGAVKAGGAGLPAGGDDAAGSQQATVTAPQQGDPLVFMSCFKWEMRKGWDVLLSAYLQEFTSDDNVELYIKTKPFLTGSDFVGDMKRWVTSHLNLTSPDQLEKLPTLYVINEHMEDRQFTGLYKAAHAFVLATRGEGWGMPISEAMSMALPVIVTNWSGVTGFVDESVGYLVDYSLSKVPYDQPWWFRGARWADASVPSLRARMREVATDRQAAHAKGLAARHRMLDKYSPAVMGAVLGKEFERLRHLIKSGQCGSKCHNKTWVAEPGDTGKDLYLGDEPFLRTDNIFAADGTSFASTSLGGVAGTAVMLRHMNKHGIIME